MLYSDRLFYWMLTPVYLLVQPMIKKGLSRLSSTSPNQTLEELIHRADRSFGVNQQCNGCGVCAKVCPVSNIEIKNNRPVWLNRCQNCLACLNWCPNQAIQGKIAQKDYYYRHPDLKLTDMMQQKGTVH